MSVYWSLERFRGFWQGPAFLGLVLILVGILVIVKPRVLEYAVGGIFILAGCGLWGAAWGMRRHVAIRRLDLTYSDDEDSNNPSV